MEPIVEKYHDMLYPLTDHPVVIKFYESENISEEDVWVIDIGNTGFFVVIFGGPRPRASQHFTPDNNDSPVLGKEKQYAGMYALGIRSFIDWWKTDKNNPSGSIPRLDNLECMTNAKMHKFLVRLLGESFQDMGNIGSDYFSKLDLEKLSQDSNVLRSIEELAEKCRQQNYMTTEPVPQGEPLSVR